MKKHAIIFVIWAISLATFACKDDSPSPLQVTENIAGTYNKTLKTSDNSDREYIVYVPESATGSTPVPVLFVIHGTNQTGRVFYNNTSLWNPKADQEGFIIVYPTALVHCHFDNGEQRSVTKWAAGDLGQTDVSNGALPLCSDEPLADDILFFDELFATIKNDFVVDENRLYASGFSNGAQMTARLATQRSEVFAAVTVHAGNLSRFITPNLAEKTMSIMVTVGNIDGYLLRFAGVSGSVPIAESSIEIPGIVGLLQPFLDITGLENTYTYNSTQYVGKNIASFLFRTSKVGANNRFQFILIEDLGHSYTSILIDPFWDFLKDKTRSQN